jgi:hypothetical protein
MKMGILFWMSLVVGGCGHMSSGLVQLALFHAFVAAPLVASAVIAQAEVEPPRVVVYTAAPAAAPPEVGPACVSHLVCHQQCYFETSDGATVLCSTGDCRATARSLAEWCPMR